MVAILTCASSPVSGSPPIIDDRAITLSLQSAMEKAADNPEIPSADALRDFANKAKRMKPEILLPKPPIVPTDTSYEALSRSVYLIGSIYKCGKCNKWHGGGQATAWCLGENGIMVTNAHVFTGTKGGAMAVSDREGNCFPVTELIGYDVATDVAVFRVQAEGLKPLRLGATADVGAPITVISNPSGNCFMKTFGNVARYSKESGKGGKSRVTWMAVTADYAKGSSGGPVFNQVGEIVGMVASTRSIYTESSSGNSKKSPAGNLQMVIKNCVPIEAIKQLFEPAPKGKSTPATTQADAN